MKDTQKTDTEAKMKVKNEENSPVTSEKEEVESFEKKNNLSGEMKKDKKEEEVTCKGDNPNVVKEATKNPAEVTDKINNQVKNKSDDDDEDITKSDDDLEDITNKVTDLKLSPDTPEDDQKLDSVECDGKLQKRGPNGGAVRHNSCENNYNYQPELKCSGSNKRALCGDVEPPKYYKPDVQNVVYTGSFFMSTDQSCGGIVNIKQSPIVNSEPFKFDSIPDAGDFIDELVGNEFPNIGPNFYCSGPGNMGNNMYQQTIKDDNLLEEMSNGPYSNIPGPPSNLSDNSDGTDSGYSGMSVNSPYQDLSSPHSNMSIKSNSSPPHEFSQDMPYPQLNIPQSVDLDYLAGREDELNDALNIIKDDILKDSHRKPPVTMPTQVMPKIQINNMTTMPQSQINSMPPNQINTITSKPQPQFQPQVTHRPVPTQNPQPTIFGQRPGGVATNPIIIPSGMIQSHQPSAVVHPIPVSTCNTVMMQAQGGIPITPFTSQPQIIIIQQSPMQAPKKPQLRNIAPKTEKPVGKKPATPATGNKSPVQKQVPRSDPVPVMSVRPTQIPGCVQQQQSNNNEKKRNLLNMARRMVAEIPREQLAYQDEEGDTYLHVAACKTDTNLILALLERLMRENMEWLIDLENKKRMTPLYLAVLNNQPEMVEVFLKNSANPNSMAQSLSSDGKSLEVKAPIHVAASGGEESLQTLRKLLSKGDITLNIANSEGHTALHTAIIAHGTKRSNGTYINSLNTIEALIKAGADPNSQDKKSGKTPLMYAIEKRDYILIEKMLRLFDPKKLRNVIKSQTFDGSNCLKIAEGRKSEFNPQDWQRLWDLLNKACTGELPRPAVMINTY